MNQIVEINQIKEFNANLDSYSGDIFGKTKIQRCKRCSRKKCNSNYRRYA